MKKIPCSHCLILKESSQFRNKRRQCKECERNLRLTYLRKNKTRLYAATKNWRDKNKERLHDYDQIAYHNKKKNSPWICVLKSIKSRCSNKNQKAWISYGAKGIKCFLTESEIKELWFRDKASEQKNPSIDRIDTYGNYEFKNCRFIEFMENVKRKRRKYQINKTKEIKNELRISKTI